MRDAACLGEITAERLREVFPAWRVTVSVSGACRAVRDGVVMRDGPESLLLRVICAPDVTGLAERLCAQDYVDGLDQVGLAGVWREMALPGVPR